MPADNAAGTLEKTAAEIPRDIVDELMLVDDFSSRRRGDRLFGAELQTDQMPERADIRANHALVLYYLERYDETQQQITGAISRNPNLPAAHSTLGLILTARDSLEAPAARYEKSLQLKPDFAEAKENLERVKKEK